MSDDALAQEGAVYIKRREEELYAAVTEKARQESLFATMVRDGADPAAIEALIAAKAQIERDIPIIGRDLSLSAQSANLSFFLVRMEQAILGFTTEITGLRGDVREGITANQEFARGLGKMEQGLASLNERMDESETDRAQLRQELEEIKRILAERPGQRIAEHQALLAAIHTELRNGT